MTENGRISSLVGTAKRGVLDRLPPAATAYLRQERSRLRKQAGRFGNTLNSAYRARAFDRALRSPVIPRTILWESFSGNGALCNPEALFRAMVNDPAYQGYSHVWVLAGHDAGESIREEFRNNPRVSFVDYKSSRYFALLESSEYLVNNATFPAEFIKRPEQVYLNTWHGTPLKKMGYDIEDGADGARNVLRNFMSADFLLSQSGFMTEQMYRTAYKLQNVFRGAIIEEGYPRTDLMFDPNAATQAKAALSRNGIEIDGKKVLLYAPTWKGESFYRPESDIDNLKSRIAYLRSLPELSDWVVLLKAHQVVYDQVAGDPELAGVLVPNDIPANSVLSVSDVLVADYSSIFVDFLATGRPILFHIPDVANYSRNRGMYLDANDLPGPISSSLSELGGNISKLISGGLDVSAFGEVAERYSELASAWTLKDDGAVSRRVLDIVFAGRESEYSVRRDFVDDRTRIVLYLGGMITNGITSAAMNLLHSLDPDKYDVTAFFYRPGTEERRANVRRLPSHIRQVIRDQGLLQMSLVGSTSRLSGLPEDADASMVDAALWRWESRRIFGQAEFDVAVDFSGYSSYWARIVLHTNARRHAVWLHNDVQADALREIDGKRPHFENLTGVFRLYRGFDALVSVSPDLAAINSSNLAVYAPLDRFVSCRNVIDAKRVLDGSGRSMLLSDENSVLSVSGNLSTIVAELGRKFGAVNVAAESERQATLSDVGVVQGKTFVTVGRLSPEKNHARLLQAFAEVHAGDPEVRLVVIGGGPLEPMLMSLAASLGVADAVTFTGVLSNPYAVMNASDCFVMSSDYEGQPIVILEARVLGLPVITTNFGSAGSAMEGSGGLIVERSRAGLVEGMRKFLAGGVQAEPFDFEEYNRVVVEEFVSAVC